MKVTASPLTWQSFYLTFFPPKPRQALWLGVFSQTESGERTLRGLRGPGSTAPAALPRSVTPSLPVTPARLQRAVRARGPSPPGFAFLWLISPATFLGLTGICRSAFLLLRATHVPHSPHSPDSVPLAAGRGRGSCSRAAGECPLLRHRAGGSPPGARTRCRQPHPARAGH